MRQERKGEAIRGVKEKGKKNESLTGFNRKEKINLWKRMQDKERKKERKNERMKE